MSIPHIAFYPSDWLAGTRGLSAEETGVYITLIARMYEMAGPIERDDERLFRLCGCRSKAAFQKCLEYLIAEGKITVVEGGIFNDRVGKEIQKSTEKSSSARASAQARWKKKPNKINDSQDANADETHMRTQCYPYIDTEKEKEIPIGISKKKASRGSRLPSDWRLPKAWGEWAVGQGMTEFEVRREADKFRDYWIAQGGAKGVKLDWQATWRNWTRSALDRRKQRAPVGDYGDDAWLGGGR